MVQIKQLLRQERKFLCVLFGVSLLVRALFFYFYTSQDAHCMLAWDSEQYEKVALQIVQGNGISTSPGVSNFYRLPGFPVFIAGLYKIFGDDRIKTLSVQVLLASLVPILIFLLSLTFFPGSMLSAKLASCIALVHTGFVLYAGIFSTETLFLITFLLFCILFFRNKYAWAGFWLGIASLVRPVGHYVVVLVIVGVLIEWMLRRHSDKKIASFFLTWLIIVAPWLIRNFMFTGYLFFHTLPGLHFLQYSASGIIEARDHCSYFQARDKLFAQWHKSVAERERETGKALNEFEYYEQAEKLAFKTMWSHPVLAIKHAVKQMARTVGTLYSTILLYVPQGTVYGEGMSLWQKIKLYMMPNVQKPWLRWVIYTELFVSLLILVGMILFLIVVVRNKFLWLPAAYQMFMVLFFVGITLSYGCARLRMQVDTFLIVMAAYGLVWAVRKGL